MRQAVIQEEKLKPKVPKKGKKKGGKKRKSPAELKSHTSIKKKRQILKLAEIIFMQLILPPKLALQGSKYELREP